MTLNPFYWIRFLLYLIFRIDSVAVKKSDGIVAWYYVFNNGIYKYIYSMEHNETAQLNANGSLTCIQYSTPSPTFTYWCPLFTFWNKKK